MWKQTTERGLRQHWSWIRATIRLLPTIIRLINIGVSLSWNALETETWYCRCVLNPSSLMPDINNKIVFIIAVVNEFAYDDKGRSITPFQSSQTEKDECRSSSWRENEAGLRGAYWYESQLRCNVMISLFWSQCQNYFVKQPIKTLHSSQNGIWLELFDDFTRVELFNITSKQQATTLALSKHMASPNTLLKLANTLLSPCLHLA